MDWCRKIIKHAHPYLALLLERCDYCESSIICIRKYRVMDASVIQPLACTYVRAMIAHET